MSDCLNILFKEEMTPRQLDQMDKLAKQLGLLDRQRYLTAGAEPLMPRLRWSDGSRVYLIWRQNIGLGLC